MNINQSGVFSFLFGALFVTTKMKGKFIDKFFAENCINKDIAI